MTSPRTAAAAPTSSDPTIPLTPPAEPTTTLSHAAQNLPHVSTNPLTSLTDSGTTKRPRDQRLIHLLLGSLGVSAYQERVPLQLMDFAYRYTSGTLQDALHLSAEGYSGQDGSGAGGGGGGRGQHVNNDFSSVSLAALRLSISSRLHYQFQPGLPKEFLMEVAAERNRVALPGLGRGGGAESMSGGIAHAGMKLPPERFCLTGVGWGLKEEWDSEGEEEEEGGMVLDEKGGENEEEEEGEGEGDERMEDIFGDGGLDGDDGEGGEGEEGDRDMADG